VCWLQEETSLEKEAQSGQENSPTAAHSPGGPPVLLFGGTILYRLRIAILLFALAIGIGTLSYMYLHQLGLVDAIYFTVVTIGTVGYGDIAPKSEAERVFTIFFILGGMTIVYYSFSVMLSAVVEGHVRGALNYRRMQKKIEQLKHHIVLCGFGRVGAELANNFAAERVPFVILENDEAAGARAEAQGHLIVRGDATSDETLLLAGIDRARVIVPALASDADNLFIVISARQAKPDIQIVSRAFEEAAAAKMLKAGADRVIRPGHIGAQHFAQAILRPTVLDFVPVSARSSSVEFGIEEVRVALGAAISNKSLAESHLRKDIGVILIGVKRAGGDLVFNPSAETSIYAGDTLVAIGDSAHLNRLRQLAGSGDAAR